MSEKDAGLSTTPLTPIIEMLEELYRADARSPEGSVTDTQATTLLLFNLIEVKLAEVLRRTEQLDQATRTGFKTAAETIGRHIAEPHERFEDRFGSPSHLPGPDQVRARRRYLTENDTNYG